MKSLSQLLPGTAELCTALGIQDQRWDKPTVVQTDAAGAFILEVVFVFLESTKTLSEGSRASVYAAFKDDLEAEAARDEQQIALILLSHMAGFLVQPTSAARSELNTALCLDASLLFRHGTAIGAGVETARAVGRFLRPMLFELMSENEPALVAGAAYVRWARRYDPALVPEFAGPIRAALNNRTMGPDFHINAVMELMMLPPSLLDQDAAALSLEALNQLGSSRQRDDPITAIRLMVGLIAKEPKAAVTYHERLVDLCFEYSTHLTRDRLASAANVHDYAGHPNGGLDLLAPVLGAYFRTRQGRRAGEVLAALRGVPLAQARVDDLLLLISSESSGSWLLRDYQNLKLAPPGRMSAATLAAQQFFGLTMRNVGDPDNSVFPVERPGVPDASMSDELEAALIDLLKFSSSGGLLPSTRSVHGALVPLQASPWPLQALLQKRLGFTLPIAMSLRPPLMDRKLRRALVWSVGTYSSEEEELLVSALLTAAGVEVTCPAERTLEAFKAYYAGDQFDLVWLGSHGEHARNGAVRLHIGTDGGLEPRQLAALRPASSDARRLLVLNACDTGRVTVDRGVAWPETGIAAAAAAPDQAVISHLWPITPWPDALGFAFVLGSSLGIHEHGRASGPAHVFFDAFETTLRMMLSGPGAIRPPLNGPPGQLLPEDTLQRFRRLMDVDASSTGDLPAWPSLLARWGSAAFYE